MHPLLLFARKGSSNQASRFGLFLAWKDSLFTRMGSAVLIACALFAGIVPSAACACNVPVFRYALERWRPDAYRVTLFHRGPLSDEERKLVQRLESMPDEGAANLTFGKIDLEMSEDPAAKELFAALEPASGPRLLVQYPVKVGNPVPLWSAELSEESVALLVDSPIRRELVSRLASGQTAVWLVLESGDAEKDKTARELVERELKRLETELKLPDLSNEPADALSADLPLAISFSVLSLPRGAAEQPLIQMLLHSEPDLAERADPLVFPVFGRGRALFPLVGRGITAENIYEWAAFLVGACSCEVKEQNPGVDLLLASNWDELLFESGAVPPASRLDDPKFAEPTYVAIPAGRNHEPSGAPPTETPATRAASPAVNSAPSGRLFVVGGISVGGLLCLVLLVLALTPRGRAA